MLLRYLPPADTVVVMRWRDVPQALTTIQPTRMTMMNKSNGPDNGNANTERIRDG